MTVHPGASPEAQGTAALGAATQEPSAAFTAGPWRVSDATGINDAGLSEFLVLGGAGDTFGLVAAVTLADDARLIAAAPDMRAALRELCAEDGNAIRGMALGVAALAKAGGRS